MADKNLKEFEFEKQLVDNKQYHNKIRNNLANKIDKLHRTEQNFLKNFSNSKFQKLAFE